MTYLLINAADIHQNQIQTHNRLYFLNYILTLVSYLKTKFNFTNYIACFQIIRINLNRTNLTA